MRAWVVVVLVGCGRFGFDRNLTGDSTVTGDDGGSGDASGDGALPPAMLLAHYRFDDIALDGVDDELGTTHAGTCLTTCPLLDAGHISGALIFDGMSDAIVIDNVVGLEPAPLSISAWINRQGVGATAIASKPFGAADLNTWQFRVDAQLALEVCTTADLAAQRCDQMGSLPGNFWHHVAFVWTGTTHRAYLNGTKVIDLGPAALAYDGSRIVFGADIDFGGATSHYRGLIDDLRIYSGVLSDADVALLAAN